MKKYEYLVENKSGLVLVVTTSEKYTEQQILEYCKQKQPNKKWVKCTYREPAPKGYHYCSCGNLARGTSDKLCDECRMIYGHTYEHEL